jgi:hypothetical protein
MLPPKTSQRNRDGHKNKQSSRMGRDAIDDDFFDREYFLNVGGNFLAEKEGLDGRSKKTNAPVAPFPSGVWC